jgi:hypothetical protein
MVLASNATLASSSDETMQSTDDEGEDKDDEDKDDEDKDDKDDDAVSEASFMIGRSTMEKILLLSIFKI